MDRAIATSFFLIRIVALLFSLATIAGRAAHLSAPLRRTVLSILMRAEPVARRVVGRVAFDLGWEAELPPFRLCGDDPDEALALAERFFQLASMLQQLLAFAAWSASMIAWPAGWQGFGNGDAPARKCFAYRGQLYVRGVGFNSARAPPQTGAQTLLATCTALPCSPALADFCRRGRTRAR